MLTIQMPFTLDDYSITELMKKREQACVLRDKAYKIRWSIRRKPGQR